jgi:hypothetical protein
MPTHRLLAGTLASASIALACHAQVTATQPASTRIKELQASADAATAADDLTTLVTRTVEADSTLIQRTATLERLRAVAESQGDDERVQRIDGLLERAALLHEETMSRMEQRAGPEKAAAARAGARQVRAQAKEETSGAAGRPQESPAKSEPATRPGKPGGERGGGSDGADRSGGETDADRRDDTRGAGRGRGNRGGPPAGKGRGRDDAPDGEDAAPGRGNTNKGEGKGKAGKPWHENHNLVTICFAPPGNPEARRTKRVGRAALQTFLDMGATQGPCDGDALEPRPAGRGQRPGTNMPRPDDEGESAGPGGVAVPDNPIIPREIIEDVIKRIPGGARVLEPGSIFDSVQGAIDASNADAVLERVAKDLDAEWARISE